MSDDFEEDLIGGDPPPVKRKPGRPKGSGKARNPFPVGQLSSRALTHSAMLAQRYRHSIRGDEASTILEADVATRRREHMEREGEVSLDVTDVHSGVTVAWLAQVFGMDPTTVKKRLADCPPMHRRKAGYVYSVKQAAAYLIKPVFDVQKYLSTMKPNELPPQLQSEYWDARLKRQKWEEQAGQLWRTNSVVDVLSSTFLMMKSTMQLWSEELDRVTALTPALRAEIIKQVDTLQDEIYKSLKLGWNTATPSTLTEEPSEEEIFNIGEEEDLIG